MPSKQLEKVVSHLRRMAGLSDAQRSADGQLLERYIASRDENAFAVLVHRYGRLVRSVCRNVLHQEQDIEDAFQATFLIFACKAASIRKSTSVASWLYGVAYRAAMNAKRTRARRCDKQREPQGRSREQPVLEASLREIQAILDEEVQRLPEKYRAPFILCCLEGKSRAEAAQQLNLKEGTVSSRLAQARKQLQQRLSRRGVALSAALCAVDLSRNAAAASIPPTLLNGTIQGASSFAAGNAVTTNLISAEVASLTNGVLKSIFTRTLKITTAALLAVGFVSGAGLLACHLLAGKPAAEQPQISPAKGKESPVAPKRDSIDVATIRGRVLDPDGKPMRGAKLYLVKPTIWPDAMPAPSLQTTSGPDGRFRIVVPKAGLDCELQEERPAQIMAVADGFGCDWAVLDAEMKEITLRLVKDAPLASRILDLNGRPVVGANITLTDLWYPKGDGLGNFLDALRKGGIYAISKSWHGLLPGPLATATTGRDGRFHLAGIGRERIVSLRIEGPAIATRSIYAMTRVSDMVSNPKKGRANSGVMKIYGAASDFVVAVSRPIRGVVLDKETGEPLAGVVVKDPYDRAESISDKEGRYELHGLAKESKYSLEAHPGDGLFFQRTVQLQDTPGLGALSCDIELVRGLMVRGRITDKETGKAIASVKINYYPLGGNTFVNKLLPGYWSPSAETATGPDGSYALTVMPGPGAIAVTAPKRSQYMPAAVPFKERKDFFKTRLIDDDDEDGLTIAAGNGAYGGISLSHCNAVVLLEPGANEKSLVRNVALRKPLQRQGRIVDPDGRPIAGVRFYSLQPTRRAENLKGAEFMVRSINPLSPRVLVFYYKEKNLGYYVKDLRREPAGPLTVRLQPCGSASGRIVDADGKPAAGLRCHLNRVDYNGPTRVTDGAAEGGYQRVNTDKDGRFHVEGLIPEQEYRVINHSDRRPGILDLFVAVIVKPGEHKEMGDLKMSRIE